VPAPSDDRLFSYTLLKAALSSPAALSESIESRLRRHRVAALKDPSTSEIDPEVDALRRLWSLAQDATINQPAKLRRLIQVLREIGVGRDSEVRVVIFSERIRTLNWIAEAIRAELRMTIAEVETFHNSKSDDEQQQIIESFAMASSPLRVLVTSDIASEGVNLHHQCHNLIHFDLPWSLITWSSAMGESTATGSSTRPRFATWSTNLPTPRSQAMFGSSRSSSRKRTLPTRPLETSGSIMGLYSESAEEDAIIAALRERTEEEREQAFEKATPTTRMFDPWLSPASSPR